MWEDGYWKGEMKDGYPACYFDDNDHFSFPWEKNLPASKDEEKALTTSQSSDTVLP